MAQAKPFFYYSNEFIKTLHKLDICLVFSTYQAGRLIFISSPTGKSLHKYAKNFRRPMGVAYDGKSLAVASRNYIEIFSRSDKLGRAYPQKKGFYDTLFVPQVKYYTGLADMHEIAFDKEEIYAVNTAFSCISAMSADRHFEPIWQPDFISELAPEDRCHLNGLIMQGGKPAYVTYFDSTDKHNGWRENGAATGVLYDCLNRKVLVDSLSMPHSPTLHDNKIFFLQSATGEVMQYDLQTNELTKIYTLSSFVRGMSVYEDYLIIGTSKIRPKSKSFGDLPVAKTSICSIEIVNHKTKKRVGGLNYTDHISEIFELEVIPGIKSPLMLTELDEGYENCINSGDDINYWLIPEEEDKP